MKFSEAYDLCKKEFEKYGYSRIAMIFVTDEAWTFSPDTSADDYGAFSMVVPRNGEEPFVLSPDLESMERYVNHATVIE